MGKGLADGITQGRRRLRRVPHRSPLGNPGIGQRVFFLHDGRTSSLVEAIAQHRSPGSEANRVIEHFNKLTTKEQQELIDFLRSL